MKEIKTIKNRFGIDIVCCCASCIYNAGATSDKMRMCKAGEGEVNTSSWCGRWKMKVTPDKDAKLGDTDLDMAGRGGGRVKKMTYLNFVRDARTNTSSEYKNCDNLALQKIYEAKFGSIYINKT